MKLRKLILAGFKSFADRTELDFHDGISVVVGPNGCGKSNIVDAIKWVLGEQSAKSLRGSEMMDVIFNGSAGRKASGCAEVTLVFENEAGDPTPEALQDGSGSGGHRAVTIGRRLFRDGRSEYLINKVPSRLKDIREMFMDTGVGTNAYSFIEQGRVESFLQASQDDRRVIFDEAAGISKYKARKKEALRKLERVEQNLLRLRDVTDEIGRRLRSIKYQAGKARSYQAHAERLKELRSLYFLAQYHTMRIKRTELQGQADTQADRLSAVGARLQQLENAAAATEIELADLDRSRREVQAKVASTGASVAANRERTGMLAARIEQLGELIVAASQRGEEAEAKIAECTSERQSRHERLGLVEAEIRDLTAKHEQFCEEHARAQKAVAQLDEQLEAHKAQAMDHLRRASDARNEVNACRIRRENLEGRRGQLAARDAQLSSAADVAAARRADAQADMQTLDADLEEARRRLEENKEQARALADDESRLRTELTEAREQRSALQGRIHTLQEMQDRHEGVSAGTRRVLEAHRQGKLPAVRGILGDFLETDIDHAPLVEAALAGADECLLVENSNDLVACAGELNALLGDSGGVEVLVLDRLNVLSDDLDATNVPGVLARAVQYVRCQESLAPAVWRLLGKTLVVAGLADAREMAPLLAAGYRLVTQAGEVVECDGRVRFGAGKRSAGIVTRRSELADLAARSQALTERIDELQQLSQTAHTRIEEHENVARGLRTAIYELTTRRVECKGRVDKLSDELESIGRERPLIASELSHLDEEIAQSLDLQATAQEQCERHEQAGRECTAAMEALTAKQAALRTAQDSLAAKMTEVRVSIASMEQEKLALSEAVSALGRRIDQMQHEVAAVHEEVQRARAQRTQTEGEVAATHDELETLVQRLRDLEQEAKDTEESSAGLNEKLAVVRKDLAGQRAMQQEASELAGQCRVNIAQADAHIEDLLARASDEMNMNLAEVIAGYQHDDNRDWDAVGVEIQDLKDKIDRLGNVNLDAIGEQEELEGRMSLYEKQVADVDESRRQLNELIAKLNDQSRDLFLETFEKVRTGFQELFRKLFGGGRADILLLDPDDVLESGLEIVARPPGKELRNLTLLSGGEKTMTALALLFSIFRAKPSPFCLLDEVDAALDEANTERFSRLVQEYVTESQFIIVSHAKRTMSMANVLYGVTMQEPGVSTRVSVRFEDAHKFLDKQAQPVGA
ncbi:MAG: chromosome segregation protein SMC [Planctomycetota bacterium]|nr:chromosome segregation protein SMC [Planctomycetota bacterium]